ncbi:hypothetical protein O0I10_001797 [Lichtheimia ornata]|uniref:Uncharacterized protein n=1 Tax=Lichtheimia ornata TaxID=688661 RepID=A0AAD7Y1X4_9FUNG|nr:uncharacterized protein O0I10_001797 [Lichtheimia ornata]KAJ8662106.1 hypothetical protein O0I10_001797 [Lichtheimia ornata]
MADGYTHPWKAYVFDTKFDIILGRDWFSMYNHSVGDTTPGRSNKATAPISRLKSQTADSILSFIFSDIARDATIVTHQGYQRDVFCSYTADKIDKYDNTFDTLAVHENTLMSSETNYQAYLQIVMSM